MTAEGGFGASNLRRVEYWTAAFAAVAALVAAVRWGWLQAVGVLAGATISWLNFRWLKQGVGNLAALATAQAGAERVHIPKSTYAKFFGRFVLLLVILYVILSRPGWPGAAVLCGLFAVVAGVVAEMVHHLVAGR
jgi:ATP synthase I chain